MLIDTHTHIVADDLKKYPLSPGYPAKWYYDTPVSDGKLLRLMNETGVHRAVLVQGFGPYGYDNSYAADAARQDARHFASVGVVDVQQPDPVGRLTYWAKDRGVRGVRLILGRAAATTPGAGHPLYPVWAKAIELGIPVCVQIQVKEGQVAWLREALRHFSTAPIALDHCGFPDFSDGPPYKKAKDFWSLAELPQVHLKVTSNLLSQVQQEGGDVRQLADRMAQTFGASRLMWGSDYSQTNHLDYRGLVELGRYARSRLSPSDREWFEGGAALTFWPELAA